SERKAFGPMRTGVLLGLILILSSISCSDSPGRPIRAVEPNIPRDDPSAYPNPIVDANPPTVPCPVYSCRGGMVEDAGADSADEPTETGSADGSLDAPPDDLPE